MVWAQVLMRLTRAWRKESASTPALVPFVATIWPVVCTVTLLPKLIATAAGHKRFVPLIVTVAIVCDRLSGPRLTVSLPIEATVPIWLDVTTIAAPLPVAPATTCVTLTLEPDCPPVKSGDDVKAEIAFAIWPATVLAVALAATMIGPAITDTPPIVMALIVPPLAFTLVTAMLPSFCTAAHSAGVVAQLIVCTRPRCLA